MAIKNTNHAFFLKAQFPLDIKQVFNTREDLINAMHDEKLAKTFYKGLTVFVNEDNTVWRWQEYDTDENKTWLSEEPFTYPSCWKTDTVDYSNKQYNFIRLYVENLYFQDLSNPEIATYLLVFDTIEDLRNYKSSPLDGETAIVKETQTIYVFDSSNTDSDDGITVIVPIGGDAIGRWIKYDDYARRDLSNVSEQDALNQFGNIFLRVDQNNNPQNIINGKPLLQDTILNDDDVKTITNKEYVDVQDEIYDSNLKNLYLPDNYAQKDLNNVTDSDLVNRLNSVIPQPLNINVQKLGGLDYTEYSIQHRLIVNGQWDTIDWHRAVKVDWNAPVGSAFKLYIITESGVSKIDIAFSKNSSDDVIRLISLSSANGGFIVINSIRLVVVNNEYFLDIKSSGSLPISETVIIIRNVNGNSILVDSDAFLIANPAYDNVIETVSV